MCSVVIAMRMDLAIMTLREGPLGCDIAVVLKQGILSPWHSWEATDAHPANRDKLITRETSRVKHMPIISAL